MADRWPTRTSVDYNCEVANPACQTILGYPPVAVHLVGEQFVAGSSLWTGFLSEREDSAVAFSVLNVWNAVAILDNVSQYVWRLAATVIREPGIR